jgi:hypothetical protein
MLGTVERHRPVLWVAGAERGQRLLPLALVRDHFGATVHQKKGERGPIFSVVVDDQGNSGVLGDVAHPFQGEATGLLRFRVDDEIQTIAGACVAEWNDVRHAGDVGGGEAGDAVAGEECPRRAIKNRCHR